MEEVNIRKTVINAFIISMEAQLRALKRMRQEPVEKLNERKQGCRR